MSFKIIYSRRKSVQIVIKSDNEIIVRCPKGTSKCYIEGFINSRQDWIKSVIAENNLKLSRVKYFYDYKCVYLFGKKTDLFVGASKNYIAADGVYVKSIKSLKNLFINKYILGFTARSEEIARRTGLRYSNIGIKDYKSRWGCCTLKGEIFFSYKIFMLPKRLIDYCIIHELCHTVYFDHSKNFWNLVENFMPDYKAARRELKEYNFVTRLY